MMLKRVFKREEIIEYFENLLDSLLDDFEFGIMIRRAITDMKTLDRIEKYISDCKSTTNGMCDCLNDIADIIDN